MSVSRFTNCPKVAGTGPSNQVQFITQRDIVVRYSYVVTEVEHFQVDQLTQFRRQRTV